MKMYLSKFGYPSARKKGGIFPAPQGIKKVACATFLRFGTHRSNMIGV